MKNLFKTVIFFLGFSSVCISGYLCAGWLEEKREIRDIKELNAKREKNREGLYSWKMDLTEEEEAFLLKHIIGEWDISGRLIALEEDDVYSANFSVHGDEAMKNVKVICYTDYVKMCGYNDIFDLGAEEIFLYTEYGGRRPVRYPVYHIDKDVEEERLPLKSLFAEEGVYYVSFPLDVELVHVHYDLGFDKESYPSIAGCYWAEDIYVDPLDTDTIYLDFCGLWEAKRSDSYSRPTGKSPTGKG